MIDNPCTIVQPYEAQAQLFKVLTHPTRLAILDILRDGDHCVCHMVAHLGLRQAYISQQLAVLREVGLIQDRRDGWNIYYRVTDPRIYSLIDVAQSMAGSVSQDRKTSNISCPCPKCRPSDH